MHEASRVCDFTVASHQGIASNSLSEHLNSQDIRNDIFSLTVNISVNKSDMIIAHNTVSESRQTFLYSLHHNAIRKSVSDMHHFFVSASAGEQQAAAITHSHATNESAASNVGMDDGDVIGEFLQNENKK
jgi:hypothetical protein